MTSTTQTTRILAQIAGPFLALLGLTIAIRRDMLPSLLASVDDSPGVIFTLGMITLLLGLVMFVLHHRWRTPVEVVLSAMGALFILRGVVLLVAPDVVTSLMSRAAHALPFAWLGGIAALLLGGWLAYEGYFKTSASV